MVASTDNLQRFITQESDYFRRNSGREATARSTHEPRPSSTWASVHSRTLRESRDNLLFHRRPASLASRTLLADAFSVKSLNRLAQVAPPPPAAVFRPRPVSRTGTAGQGGGATLFRKYYDRGDLPVALEHDPRAKKLAWKVDIEKLDIGHYLPLFFEGLRETRHPYTVLARRGVGDLLHHGMAPNIAGVIPNVVLPLKEALSTRNPAVISTTLKCLQQLIASKPEVVGPALVPYYRQILPMLRLFKTKNKNIGDGIEYGQRRQENIGDLIEETLEMMETHGGPDAYINIKYMIPTYESCVVAR